MSCDYQCEPRNCLFCLGTAIENEIFAIIQSEQEGEIDEEWYENKLDKFRHNEVDTFITEMDTKRCERLVYEFGIYKALKHYNKNFGEICINDHINVCKTLVYVIVDDALCVTYIDYQNWCESHPLDEDEN